MSNDMKLIMENWRKNVISPTKEDLYYNMLTEEKQLLLLESDLKEVLEEEELKTFIQEGKLQAIWAAIKTLGSFAGVAANWVRGIIANMKQKDEAVTAIGITAFLGSGAAMSGLIEFLAAMAKWVASKVVNVVKNWNAASPEEMCDPEDPDKVANCGKIWESLDWLQKLATAIKRNFALPIFSIIKVLGQYFPNKVCPREIDPAGGCNDDWNKKIEMYADGCAIVVSVVGIGSLVGGLNAAATTDAATKVSTLLGGIFDLADPAKVSSAVDLAQSAGQSIGSAGDIKQIAKIMHVCCQ